MTSHLDQIPSLASSAGMLHLNVEMLKGKRIGKKSAKIHLEGYDVLPSLTGKVAKSPRNIFHYLSDEGKSVAVRVGDWKSMYA
jgi:arylsulfatase